MKVTIVVSALMPYDKNIDVEVERAYNRECKVTIGAYEISSYFDLNRTVFVIYWSKGNEIHVPVHTSIANIVFA